MKTTLIQSVELSSKNLRVYYPFFVTGLLTLASGKVESFAWALPHLDDADFDWTQARISKEALELIERMRAGKPELSQ